MKEKNLNLIPEDREEGYPKGTPKYLRRILEIMPGAFVWFILLMPIVFPLLGLTEAFIFYIVFTEVYWTFRSINFTYGLIEGYRRVERDMATDWIALLKSEYREEFDELRYVYICPVYGETIEGTLDGSFKSWSRNDVGAEKIDVVFAIEERKKELQLKNFEYLKKKYGKKFGSMRYYVHPQDIPGEVQGVKGGNLNWAGRHFVEDLEKQGKDISKYLVITCDSDQRTHPKYLSAITYKYFSSENRDRSFYATALHTYNNNVWKVPPLIRVYSLMGGVTVLQNWVVKKEYNIPFSDKKFHCRESFSSFVLNLKTLKDIKFWNPTLANDDSVLYWNALVRFKGDFRGEEVYIPTYNDAVENETALKSYISFFKQQYRWGWGIINFPLTMAGVLQDKVFPKIYKYIVILSFLENQIWYLTIVYSLTFGLRFLSFFNNEYVYTAMSVNVDKFFLIMSTALIFSNAIMIYYRRKITPVPKDWKWWRHILDVVETLLLTVNMLTFNFIPRVQAFTDVMFGRAKKKKNFYITEKINIKNNKALI